MPKAPRQLHEFTRAIDKTGVLNAFKTAIADNAADSAYLESLAFLAAEGSIPEALELPFEAGVSPTVVNKYDEPLLHVAAEHTIEQARQRYQVYVPLEDDVAATVNLLLDRKVSALRKNRNGYTCFHLAAQQGNHRFITALARRDVRLSLTDSAGNTAVHLAAEGVRAPISNIESMSRAKQKQIQDNFPAANIERTAKEITTSETLAECFFLTVQVLAEAGVDITEKNNNGQTALDIAQSCKAKKLSAFLSGTLWSDAGLDDDSIVIGGQDVFQAIIKRDHGALEAILRRGADLSAHQESGKSFEKMTPLGIACALVDPKAVELLLAAGANALLKDDQGRAPIAYCLSWVVDNPSLWNAALDKSPQRLLKSLLSHGFDIDAPVDEESNTALILACKTEHGGANPNGRADGSIRGALQQALLENAANLNLANRHGETALMWACIRDSAEMENLQTQLLEGNADVAAKDRKGDTALHYAARNPSNSQAKNRVAMLLDFGADASAVNNNGHSVLDLATAANNEPLVKLLLAKM